jgi:hypothetical protein
MNRRETHMTETLNHALTYAERGWRVIPIKPGEKRPPISAWQTAATTNPDTITKWWTGPYRNHGVGIATGEESGVFVLDIDLTDEKNGYRTIEELEAEYGPLPAGPRALTGSGGLHIFLANPPGTTIRNDAGKKLGTGIDIRGEGGQVVAAPTIHPNGNTYQWLDGSADIAVPDAPAWLLQTLADMPYKPPSGDPAGAHEANESPHSADDYSAAANYNRRTNWHDLLTADGWTYTGQDHTGEHYWVRPGKDPRDGNSATVGHQGRDALTVFTTSIDWLPPGTYSRFGYYACRHHNGDRSAAARHLRQLDYAPIEQFLAELPTIEPTTQPNDEIQVANRTELAHLVNWDQFWTGDHSDEDWLAYPVIPRGRAISLFAPAKAGKSTVVLAVAAAVATGKPILGLKPVQPVDVLYLDYEMTQADLYERLVELGYGPDDNLQQLHYALLPSLPPLDSIEGARAVLALVDATNAELVIVDTFGRAVEGDEDSADTVRAFYRHTGLTLKARGVTYLRTDHSGKDVNKGQRGSSAKNDDVDLVWKLQRTDTNSGQGITLTRTHSRISWVPETIKIIRNETDTHIDYRINDAEARYPDGTAFDMQALQAIGITHHDSQRTAAEKAKAAGLDLTVKRIRNAIKMLKERARQIDPLEQIHKRTSATSRSKPTTTHHRDVADHPNDVADDAPYSHIASRQQDETSRSEASARRGVRLIKKTHPSHPSETTTTNPTETDPLDIFGT